MSNKSPGEDKGRKFKVIEGGLTSRVPQEGSDNKEHVFLSFPQAGQEKEGGHIDLLQDDPSSFPDTGRLLGSILALASVDSVFVDEDSFTVKTPEGKMITVVITDYKTEEEIIEAIKVAVQYEED